MPLIGSLYGVALNELKSLTLFFSKIFFQISGHASLSVIFAIPDRYFNEFQDKIASIECQHVKCLK